MSRYHYNFETGEVGVCRAKIQCPLANAPHFDDKQKAMNYVEEIEKINAPEIKTVKKKMLNSRVIDKDVKNFSKNFVKDGAMFLATWHSPEQIDKFEYLDKGAECNVYLSPNGKFVYKIPNNFDAVDVNEIYEILSNDKLNYENIDHEFLRENNCEYLETRFIDLVDDYGNKNMIIAQPYLNGDEYEDVEVNPLKDEEYNFNEVGKKLDEVGFSDLEEYNMKIRKSDGRIILFDCLPY